MWHFTMLPVLLSFAVLEEVVFRRGVQESLLLKAARDSAWGGKFGHISLPSLLTAILFSAVNGMIRSWTIAALAFPVALFLGWLYERYRRLWPCIVAHALINTLWLLLAPWLGFLQNFF